MKAPKTMAMKITKRSESILQAVMPGVRSNSVGLYLVINVLGVMNIGEDPDGGGGYPALVYGNRVMPNFLFERNWEFVDHEIIDQFVRVKPKPPVLVHNPRIPPVFGKVPVPGEAISNTVSTIDHSNQSF